MRFSPNVRNLHCAADLNSHRPHIIQENFCINHESKRKNKFKCLETPMVQNCEFYQVSKV